MPSDLTDLELLRDLAGPDAPVLDAVVDRARAALSTAVAAESGSAPARVRRPIRSRFGRSGRRPRAALVLALLAFAGAATGAAYLVAFEPSQPSVGSLCASEVSRTPSGAVLMDDARSLAAQCAELWRTGVLGDTVDVPPVLTACHSGSGAIYVFPAGPEVCARLELRPASDLPSADKRRFLRFRDAVVPRIAARCVTFGQAERIVTEELHRAALDGWRVRRETASDGAAGACASLAFDDRARTVVLVPM